jgi:hypothetical protein
MNPPGSGASPTFSGLSITCTSTGGLISFTCNKAISESACGIELISSATGEARWSGSIPSNTNAKPFTISGVPSGSYVLLADNGEATNEVPLEVSCATSGGDGGTTPPPTPAAPGCTDPAALNYDAAATSENGTCAYTPPALPEPFFQVPLLQALRFVVRGGDFETMDNVLFCEQHRPGQQVRPYFYQLVEFGDTVRVQVLTSYTAVAATILRHGGPAAGPATPLQRVLTLEGMATPFAVALTQDVASGTTQLRAATGGSLPPGLLAATRLTLAGTAPGTYRVTAAVPGSVVSLDDYLVLNRPWVVPAAGALTATWLLRGPGYNVWEADLPLSTLAAGYYQVRLVATRAGLVDAEAISEPLHLAARHDNTVVLDYRNADNCFGLVFTTGLTPRLRVPGTFFRQTNGGTLSTYRASAGGLTTLASTATRRKQLETYALPAYLHEKIFLACRLDELRVNGERCQTDEAYETSENRNYPLSGGRVVLEQADWLGSGNGNDAGLEEAPDNALALRGGGYLLLRGPGL